jgi:thiol:disulfide interchange protein
MDTWKQKAGEMLLKVLVYLLKKVLLPAIVLSAVVALSFLFTGKFSVLALSDRIFWVGMAVNILAGILVLFQGAAGRDFGVAGVVRKPADAKKLLDSNLDIRVKMEKRYNIAGQVWLIGMACVGLSALVQVLFPNY